MKKKSLVGWTIKYGRFGYENHSDWWGDYKAVIMSKIFNSKTRALENYRKFKLNPNPNIVKVRITIEELGDNK